MITLVVLFILSIVLVWIVFMYSLWKKEHSQNENLPDLAPIYNQSSRALRKLWFATLRAIDAIRAFITRLATKAFFAIFPSARKAFEEMDKMTGLKQGPSSYFLKSISPDRDDLDREIKKDRRKRKNV